MAPLRWACSCCLRFKFSPEEIEQRHKSQQIDRMLEKDKHAIRRQVKLLLLGAGESGKSTFLKQMKIIHGQRFEPEIVKEFQTIIYQNIVRGMKVLVDARQKLSIPWENPKNSAFGQHLLRFDNSVYLDSHTFQDYAPSIKRLWMDSAIRQAYDRRREFQLVFIYSQQNRATTDYCPFLQSDSVKYFLENVDRIARLVRKRKLNVFILLTICATGLST